jgi:hypothetical protein
MARPPIFAEHTNAHTLEVLTAESRILNKYLDPLAERRLAVWVDGVPLGERLNEIRYQGSSFFGQPFFEAVSVAHLAVSLDLDRKGRVDVRRLSEPQPDIELSLNRELIAFVEETMVMDQQAHKITLAVDKLNDRIDNCDELAVRTRLDTGTLTVRINHLPEHYYGSAFPVDAVFEEICRFVRALSGEISVLIDTSEFALLGELKAGVRYLAHGKTSNPVSLFEHGRAGVLLTVFAEQIRKKRKAAKNYPPASRPRWLLLDIDMHFERVDTEPLLAIIARENPQEFDRVVVQQVRGKPLIVELPAFLNERP